MERKLGRVITIGQGSQTPEELVARLESEDTKFLIDVRSSPYSKYQPGFSKEPLEALLDRHDIKYVYMGDLIGGLPKDESCYTNGRVDYTKCKDKEPFIKGVARIQNAYEKGLSVCLMCSEGKPSECHRTKLIGEMLAERNIQVIHLLPGEGNLTQEEVINEITGGQGNLFGEEFTSKKTY